MAESDVCSRPVQEPIMRHHSLNRLVTKLDSIISLSDAERTAILDLPIRVRDLAADQDIGREGDRPSQCSLVVEGFLCRYKTLPDGSRTIMAFYVPGDIPDVHSLHIELMDHTLGTVTTSKVGFIPHEDMRRLTQQHPHIAEAFWRETLIDAAIFREWIVNLGSREAYSRIAHLFCEIFLKLKAVGLTHGHSFDFPVTQAKIADATGLSDVHVNRSLMKLRADGLIAIERGRCTIPDMGRLEEAAMFDPTYLHLKELAPSPARVAAQ